MRRLQPMAVHLLRGPVRYWLGLIVFLASAPMVAQTPVSGRITERTTGGAVAGVVVSALDARGTVVGRVVSDLNRGFTITLAPTATRLQFRRIGFSPLEISIAQVTDGRVEVVMTRLPTQLPPVRAVAQAICDPDPDREVANALWQEARSGLLASIVARESHPAHVQVLTYSFWYTPNGSRLAQTVARTEYDSATTGFFATPAATLARKGYIDVDATGRSYLGPDDVVLFDETFYTTHCFSLDHTRATGDSLIGIRFEPSKDRRKTPEVEGTVWLKRQPLDLRAVDFRYANVESQVRQHGGGGYLEFTPMPNGITMLSRWYIRGVAISRRAGNTRPNETGGLLEFVQWRSGETYLKPLPSVTGTIRTRAGAPAPEILVGLTRSPYLTRTDSNGTFTLQRVLPGRYELAFGDPALVNAGIDVQPPDTIYVQPTNTELRAFTLDTPKDVIERVCRQRSALRPKGADGDAAIFGQVVDSTGRPVPGAKLQVDVIPNDAGQEAGTYEGRTDSKGAFRLCKVSDRSMITISVDGLPETRMPGPAKHEYAMIKIVVPARR